MKAKCAIRYTNDTVAIAIIDVITIFLNWNETKKKNKCIFTTRYVDECNNFKLPSLKHAMSKWKCKKKNENTIVVRRYNNSNNKKMKTRKENRNKWRKVGHVHYVCMKNKIKWISMTTYIRYCCAPLLSQISSSYSLCQKHSSRKVCGNLKMQCNYALKIFNLNKYTL